MNIKNIIAGLFVVVGLALLGIFESLIGKGIAMFLVVAGVWAIFYKKEVDERAINNGLLAARVGFIVYSLLLALGLFVDLNNGLIFASGMIGYVSAYYLYDKGIL